MDQTGGRVETCQVVHGPDRWQSRDLSGNAWTRERTCDLLLILRSI
jgi:hypothetical protein